MRVLVAYASKHGATKEIAEAVAAVLRGRRFAVDIRAAEDVDDLRGYDAVVLGSAVYAGQWMHEAKKFLADYDEALQARPVWLFSSGPVGDPPKPAQPSHESDTFMQMSGALEHRIFSGRLERSGLSRAERAVVAVVRAKEGDFRDWRAVDRWAREIADELQARSTYV